jgi:hypothetical protein
VQTRKPPFASKEKPIKIPKSLCFIALRLGEMDLNSEARRRSKTEVTPCVKLSPRGSRSLGIYMKTNPMLLLP